MLRTFNIPLPCLSAFVCLFLNSGKVQGVSLRTEGEYTAAINVLVQSVVGRGYYGWPEIRVAWGWQKGFRPLALYATCQPASLHCTHSFHCLGWEAGLSFSSGVLALPWGLQPGTQQDPSMVCRWCLGHPPQHRIRLGNPVWQYCLQSHLLEACWWSDYFCSCYFSGMFRMYSFLFSPRFQLSEINGTHFTSCLWNSHSCF